MNASVLSIAFLFALHSSSVFASSICELAITAPTAVFERVQKNPDLYAVLGQGITGASSARIVMNYDSFASGLRREGMAESDVQTYLSGIKGTMELTLEQKVPALLPAVLHINRHGGTSPANRNLLVCTVPTGCQLNTAFFGNLATITAHDVRPTNFSWGDLQSIPSQSSERSDGLLRDEVLFTTQYRAVPGPEGVPMLAEWQGQFFRDVMLSANFELLSKWIKTNSGSAGNQLFNAWISIKDGHVTIDKSFYAVFALSRSRAAYFHAMKLVLEEFTVAGDQAALRWIRDIEAQVRANAVIDIKNFAGEQALKKFGVAEANVLEIGQQLAKMIEDTTL